ncbi:carboxylesterase NlhH-like [Babylonia areolata]|uniref:carboxylesterase NlhH-like n=1 Tax=Babylonia areolata TaxID=304850 RepID=UPI003FD31898
MLLKIPLYITAGILLTGVAVVVMWLPQRVPDWAEQRGTLQILVANMDFAALLAHPVSWVRGQDYLKALRSIISYPFVSKDLNSPSMKVSRTELDGVGVQVFRPQPAPDLAPAIIFMHGGGWTIIPADMYANTCHRMAAEYNVVVISIDYRQAPEHPYPAPFEDCLKVVVHVLKNAQTLGLDPDRIAVAGDSAGGNLAAAVALRLSQKDMARLPPLQFQVLIYPVLQMVDLNTPSYTNFSSSGGPLTKHLMTKMWLAYMGYPELRQHLDEFKANRHSAAVLKDGRYASYLSVENLPAWAPRVPGFQPVRPDPGNETLAAQVRSRILDPYFAPLMAEDVSNVPPAYFVMANIDILRDEGLLYAERLRRAGVETEVDFYPGMSHGFFVVNPALVFDRCLQALGKLGTFVKENL